MIELSIVIPVYNEEKNINIFIERTTKTLNKILEHKNYEIIFCLDPSLDNSEKIIKENCKKNKNVALIKMSRRFGQPACTMAGIKNCKGNYCVIIDADLQDPPELIEELYIKAKSEDLDVVYAERKSREGLNWFYKLISYFGYYIINKFSDVKIPRNSGDFRIISRRVINQLSQLKETHGFLRGLVSFVGFSQGKIIYNRPIRKNGETNYNKLFGSTKIALNGLIGYSNFLLNILFLIGIFLILLSFIFAIFLIYNNVFGSKIYPLGISSIILSILFFSSIQLLGLSFLGQYISRIYDEVKDRPAYIIDEKINI